MVKEGGFAEAEARAILEGGPDAMIEGEAKVGREGREFDEDAC